jgi:putative YphP/YqiW family bacilliredoxin
MSARRWDPSTDGELSEKALRRRLEAEGCDVSRYVYPPGTHFPERTHGVDDYNGFMPYPEPFIAPMRAELTRVGARELRTPEDVDAVLCERGTVMIVVNSVCGCAAGKARPGIAMALQHAKRPDVVGTVFAGADIDATARAREAFAPYPPSSPSVGLLRGGKLVYMLERRQIEMRDAQSIAAMLTAAFDEHCD